MNNRNEPSVRRMFPFLIEKSMTAKSPLILQDLAQEYKMKFERYIPIHRISGRIDKCRLLVATEDIELETKIRMLFALSIPIEDAVLAEMEQIGQVHLDGKRRLIKFLSGRRSGFNLEGVHTDIPNTIRDDAGLTEDNILSTPRNRIASKRHLDENFVSGTRSPAKKRALNTSRALPPPIQDPPAQSAATSQALPPSDERAKLCNPVGTRPVSVPVPANQKANAQNYGSQRGYDPPAQSRTRVQAPPPSNGSAQLFDPHEPRQSSGAIQASTFDKSAITPAQNSYSQQVQDPSLSMQSTAERKAVIEDPPTLQPSSSTSRAPPPTEASPQPSDPVQTLPEEPARGPQTSQTGDSDSEVGFICTVKQEPQVQVQGEQKPPVGILQIPYQPANIIPMEKHVQILEAVDNIITMMQLTIQEEELRRLRAMIESKFIEKPLRIKEFETAINASLLIATKCEAREGRLVSRFVLLLSSLVTSLKIPELNTLKEELQECDAQFIVRDQFVPVERLESAVYVLLDIITP